MSSFAKLEENQRKLSTSVDPALVKCEGRKICCCKSYAQDMPVFFLSISTLTVESLYQDNIIPFVIFQSQFTIALFNDVGH